MDAESDQRGPNSLQRAERKTRALSRTYRNKAADRQLLSGGPSKKESKLSNGTIMMMVGMAIFYDIINFLLNLIPVVGDPIGTFLLGAFVDFHYYVWFKIKGVNFSKKPGRALIFFGSEFLETLPVVDEFAVFGILSTIISVRIEEKLEEIPIIGKAAKKIVSIAEK